MKTQLDIYLAAHELAYATLDIQDSHELVGRVWDACEAYGLRGGNFEAFNTHFRTAHKKLNLLRTQNIVPIEPPPPTNQG